MFNAASTNLIWARLSWSVCSDGACTRGTSVGPSSCEAPLASRGHYSAPCWRVPGTTICWRYASLCHPIRLRQARVSQRSGLAWLAFASEQLLFFFFLLFPSRHLTSDRLHFSFPENPLQIQFSPLLPLWSSAESWTSSPPATCCYMSREVTDISSNIDL